MAANSGGNGTRGLSFWAAEPVRVERLIELYPDKRFTTSEIARLLGCSKNAVIAKAHRLGLEPRIEAPIKLLKPTRADPGIGCHWPIGHPTDKDFHFCGEDRHMGKPYCARHAAVAYIRPKKGGQAEQAN